MDHKGFKLMKYLIAQVSLISASLTGVGISSDEGSFPDDIARVGVKNSLAGSINTPESPVMRYSFIPIGNSEWVLISVDCTPTIHPNNLINLRLRSCEAFPAKAPAANDLSPGLFPQIPEYKNISSANSDAPNNESPAGESVLDAKQLEIPREQVE